MSLPGTPEQPLRVAIVGAGPTGFYAAESLLRQSDLTVTVDVFDRLPTPFGLVRGGVAPDHQKIKSVTRVFEKTAALPGFRFFGGVELGRDVSVADLQRHYHAILLSTGAQTDRNLGIPGEDLTGSFSATQFVAWYNGHPDARDLSFDLSTERVAIVGVGNVAMDVARILVQDPEALARTDIADHALEALRQSRVREVYVLGRRGAAQAAFTTPEIRELGEMEGVDVVALADEVALDPLSARALEASGDKATTKNIEILQGYAARQPEGRPRRLVLRFLVSPVEVVDDGAGRVGGLRIVRNMLVEGAGGRLEAKPTGQYEDLPVGLVFRSVGYKGVPIEGVPFDARRGTIPHDCGRVTEPATGTAVPGVYVAGWIKRGPSGVIGTNKPCAVETVAALVEDARAGRLPVPEAPAPEAAETLVRERQPAVFSYADWQALDAVETARGAEAGRPRVKLTRLEEMRAAVGR